MPNALLSNDCINVLTSVGTEEVIAGAEGNQAIADEAVVSTGWVASCVRGIEGEGSKGMGEMTASMSGGDGGVGIGGTCEQDKQAQEVERRLADKRGNDGHEGHDGHGLHDEHDDDMMLCSDPCVAGKAVSLTRNRPQEPTLVTPVELHV